MYGSIRWLIGLATLYILLTIFGNTLDQGAQLITSAESGIAQSSLNYQAINTTSSTVGTIGVVGNLLPSTLDGWGRMLSWDYSFWYEYDSAGNRTGESPMRLIYYIIFVPLTGGMIILLLQVLRQLLLGF
jgi:hypothetical protein